MIIDYDKNKLYIGFETPGDKQLFINKFRHLNPVITDDFGVMPSALVYAINTIPIFNPKVTDRFKAFTKGIDKNKVIIVKDTVWSYVYGKDLPFVDFNDAMKYFWKPAVRNKRFQAKKWDGYISLYHKVEQKFASGLVDLCEEVLKKHNRNYEIVKIYKDREKVYNFEYDKNIIPDADQIEAVNAGLKNERCILKAPTGFGKTFLLAANITAQLGLPTLFIANKKQLVGDAAKDFMKSIIGLDKVGMIGDGIFGDKEGTPLNKFPVIVATIQSLAKKVEESEELKDYLNNTVGLVIVDECQALGTPQWNLVMENIHCNRRICLSATPQRTDEKVNKDRATKSLQLQAHAGPIAFFTTAEEQIEKGRLCELEINYHAFDQQLFNQNDKEAIYAEAYKNYITENFDRTKFTVDLVHKRLNEGRFVLLLFTQIEHGKNLYNELILSGLKEDEIALVYGGTSTKMRESAIEAFRKGKLKMIIGSTIFDAGVNIPLISSVIMAGGGNSDISLVQRIGRGARQCDYEDVLGYLPEFMKKTSGKVTVIDDIMDKNVVFFERQGWNRYKIAQEEFGESRVKIIGTWEKRTKKKDNPNNKEISDAQFEMLEQFKRNSSNNKSISTPSQFTAFFGK